MKYANTIIVQLGDHSGDGHRITEDHIVLTNLNKKQIDKAYALATSKIGINFQEKCCTRAYDCTIDKADIDLLKRFGVSFEGLTWLEEEFDDNLEAKHIIIEDNKVYVHLWLRIAKIGNPDLQYRIYEPKVVKAGGYGLFDPEW